MTYRNKNILFGSLTIIFLILAIFFGHAVYQNVKASHVHIPPVGHECAGANGYAEIDSCDGGTGNNHILEILTIIFSVLFIVISAFLIRLNLKKTSRLNNKSKL